MIKWKMGILGLWSDMSRRIMIISLYSCIVGSESFWNRLEGSRSFGTLLFSFLIFICISMVDYFPGGLRSANGLSFFGFFSSTSLVGRR